MSRKNVISGTKGSNLWYKTDYFIVQNSLFETVR